MSQKISDSDLALAFAQLLVRLNTSSVQKYKYFFERDPDCKYTQKSLQAFQQRDKARLLKAIKQLVATI